MKKKKERVATHRVALDATRRGLSPVPLGEGSKRPSGGPAWNKVIIGENDIEEFFSDGENVGVLWGKPSGWVVDVDLDCSQAIVAASSLLPETFIYGRERRPRSHYIYRSRDCPTAKFIVPGGAVLVEVRSTGKQSVWPGSVGPEGDKYAIDLEIEIAEVNAKLLMKYAGQVAAVSLLAQLYPEAGSRHDYVHQLTGALMRDGFTVSETRKVMRALISAVDDQETDPKQRIRTIENTIEHSEAGDRTQGWATLETYVNGEKLKRAREWLRKSNVEAVPITVLKDGSIKLKILPMPAAPEGLLADIAKWSHDRSHVHRTEFDLGVALMSLALATGNKFLIDGYRTPLQPYMMMSAPTGGGKESALDAVFAFSRKIGSGDSVFQGFQSYHSMLDTLSTEPNMALWLWDEAARKLKTASRSAGGQDFQVMSWLLSLYGRAATAAPAMPGRNRAIAAIERPYFLCLAASQPDQLVEAITETDLSTGLLNRFILFDAGDDMGAANYDIQDIFPSRVEAAVRKIRERHPPSGENFIPIGFANARVFALFREFNEEARRYGGEDPKLGVMWVRANQNALIVAGLAAVSQSSKVITEEHALFGQNVARRSVEAWLSRMNLTVMGNQTEKGLKTIEGYVRDARKYAGRAKVPLHRALLLKGLMPRTVLIRLVNGIRSRGLDDYVARLIESGILGEGNEQGHHVYFSRDES